MSDLWRIIERGNQISIIQDEHGKPLCDMYRGLDTTTEEVMAQARLIVAAPMMRDLLEVIEGEVHSGEYRYRKLYLWAKLYGCAFPPSIARMNDAVQFAITWAIKNAGGSK